MRPTPGLTPAPAPTRATPRPRRPTPRPGIYGLNFDSMPELRWVYGDPIAVGLMVVTAAALLIWFRRRHWV